MTTSIKSFIERFRGTAALPEEADVPGCGNDLFKRSLTIATAAFEADDNTQRHVLWKNPCAFALRIVSAEYIPDAAVTASDTNYSVITLYHTDTPASGTDKVAAQASTTSTGGTGNLVADTPEAVPISSTEANLVLDPGEYLVLHYDGTNGTGVDLPTGRLIVVHEVA